MRTKLYPNGYPYYAMMMMGLADKERTSTLAKNIRELRVDKLHITQKEFAQRVQEYSAPRGVKFGGKYGNTLVSQYERQICSPKIDNLISICEAFQVNPVELCGYDLIDEGSGGGSIAA